MLMYPWAKQQKGFTIVELLIVIVIIAILAAITIVAYNGIQQRARDAQRASSVSQIKKAVEMYKIDNGSYPQACSADNAGCAITLLTPYLVPKYINSLPLVAGYTQYVRGAVATDSYAILVSYEATPVCKTGDNINPGWWGGSVPIC